MTWPGLTRRTPNATVNSAATRHGAGKWRRPRARGWFQFSNMGNAGVGTLPLN